MHRLSRGDIEVLGDWFVLHLVRNPGAAFSTGTEFTVVFSLVAIVGGGRRAAGSRGRSAPPLWAVALGLLLAGIAGNLTDRIFRDPGPLRGHVVDLFMVPHWPVFNVADVCIDVAAGLILLQAFRNVRLDGTRRGEPRSTRVTAVDHRVPGRARRPGRASASTRGWRGCSACPAPAPPT